MRDRAFALIIALFVLCSVAAQGYYVRSNGNYGLMDRPAWTGQEMDRVTRGEVLHVVGQEGDFLQIRKSGRDLWLEGRGNTVSQPLADGANAQTANNCCHVGWTCNTDKDWADGYSAYQRFECYNRSTNCCFRGWKCDTEDDWTRGFKADQAGDCHASGLARLSPSDEPSAASLSTNAVRVTFHTNLRSSNSLQSRIVTTVAPGTILGVLGRQGRWLKIDWRGREVWLADWAPMTAAGEATVKYADAPPVDIPEGVDNCCFVNWTCTTDEDWQNGYFALQENQCNAPGPAGSIPEGADNCCNVNRQCNTDGHWEYGYELFKYDLCYVPDIAGNIKITGSSAFVSKTRQALRLLLDKSPQWYRYTQQGLRGVKEIPMGGDSGIFVTERIYRSWPNFRSNRRGETHVIWVAGQLVHEACHVNRYVAGLEHSGYVGEKACLIEQINALEAIDPHDRVVGGRYTRLANIDDPAEQWWLYR